MNYYSFRCKHCGHYESFKTKDERNEARDKHIVRNKIKSLIGWVTYREYQCTYNLQDDGTLIRSQLAQ